MIIKKYISKTEEEAVETARKELGQNVVIMSVRQIKKKGFLGFMFSPQVEVTVALEEDSEKQPPKPPTMTALEQLAAKQKEINEQKKNAAVQATPLKSSQPDTTSVTRSAAINKDIIEEEAGDEKNSNVIEEKLDSIETLIKQRLDSADNKEEQQSEQEEAAEDEQMKLTRLLYNMMIDNEVREKYANQIIEEAQKQTKPSMPVDYFLTTVYQKMILKFGQTSLIEPAAAGPRVVYFIGPTGVGKTTTIAKIASKFCLEEKKKVALLTADTYRIAAAEQLRTYANILDIPCRVIYSADEIVEAYGEYLDYDYIFVDTAGHSHHNEEQKNNTNVVIHALDGKTDAMVYLVLSATTKYKDLTSIADTYREMTDYKIIFTKLDETTSLGNLLNLKLYTESDLSYVTYGQNVPDDIGKFDPQSIVKQILGGNAQGHENM